MADLDLARVKRNVAKMASMNAPVEDIDGYIASEGTTVEAVRSFRPGSSGIAADDPRMEFIRRAKENVANGTRPEASPGHSEFGERFSGIGMNATAGANSALYSTLGTPVDLMRGAMNLGVRGINAATGTDIGMIPEDSFGGSRSIGQMMGAMAPQLDPQNTVASTTGERVARGLGEGAGYALAPEAALAGLTRSGAIGGRAADMAGQMFGRAASTGAVAGNAAVGGVSGAAASAAMEAAPDEYKPIAGLLGGMAGGVGPVAAGGLPALGREAVRIGQDVVAPMTAAGRERIAAETLREASSDPAALRGRLERGSGELVPGSAPTTFQQTGDMGLGALERGIASKRPEMFNQRRADQNAARVAATEGLQKTGSPEAVVSAVRERLALLDRETQGVVDKAATGARKGVDALGAGLAPEEAGSRLRSAYESGRGQAKAQERQLWAAVDPDGTLALPAASTRTQVREIRKALPKSAKPMSGEEAAIFEAAGSYKGVVPFSELTALQSRIKTEMRAERVANGESPSLRRMTMLNGAIQDDLDRAVMDVAARDAEEVASGAKAATETLAARIDKLSAPKTGLKVYSPSGQAYDVDYQLVEADDLIASNRADGSPNPAYPASLQPRDRTRAASDAQVSGISRNLQPERLGASTDLATGAPLVGSDNIVESGNGRVAAIARAYRENGRSAKAYREYLAREGYPVEGMRNPVLVRRRLGELDDAGRARLTQEANASQSLAMSASEQAATDASRLKPEVLALYRGGDVSSTENRDFARAFLGAVADKGQEGAFVTGSGSLAMDGAGRMRNALLAAAYDDPRIIAALTDEGDENIRAFGRAMSDLAGDVARLRSGIRSGQVEASADLAPAMTEAAGIVQKARAGNVRIADLVSQADAFNPVSREGMKVLQLAYGPELSGRLSRERLNDIIRQVIGEAEQQTAGARLFGEALDANAILDGAMARYGNASQATGTTGFAGQPFDRSGNAALRSGEGRPGALSQGSQGFGGVRGGAEGAGTGGASAGRGPGGVDPRILADVPLEPNFDGAALGRLRAASDATRERAETFDNKTLAPLRKRPSTTAPYDVSDSSVAAKLFKPGSDSFDAIRTYRKAVGDPAAIQVLESYAIDRLRKAALREDGTLDPAKVEGFRRFHSDALRAFPALDARLASAAKASETLAEVTKARKVALDEAQRGQLGKLLGLDAPSDVVRAIGGVFQSQDAVRRMMMIRKAVGSSKEAQEGLRKAVVDHMLGKLVGNTEAAASGIGMMKSDQFQTFVRQNGPALSAAGFSADEIKTMGRIAEDLQRANRSLAAVKIPGQSNTVQDAWLISKNDGKSSMLTKAMLGLGIGGGAAVGGPVSAVVGGYAADALKNMRLAGIEKVDDLLADALLNPARAKILLATPARKTTDGTWQMLGQMYRRAVAVSGASTLDGDGSSAERREPTRITVTEAAGGMAR